MKDIIIEIKKDEGFGYSVLFNGEIILECAGKDEINETTIGELIDFARDAEIF